MTGKDLLIQISSASLAQLISDRQFHIDRCAHVEAEALDADKAWQKSIDETLNASATNYTGLRAALHDVLRTGGIELSDQELVDKINAAVRLAETIDRPALAGLEPVQIIDQHPWPPRPETLDEIAAAASAIGAGLFDAVKAAEADPGTETMAPVARPFDRPVLAEPCDPGPWEVSDSVEVLNDDYHLFARLLIRGGEHDPDSDLWLAEVETIDTRYGQLDRRPALGSQISLREHDYAHNRLDERLSVQEATQ